MVEYSAFNRFVPGSSPGQPNKTLQYKKNQTSFQNIHRKYNLEKLLIMNKDYPQGNSNPRYLREREMS